MTKSPLKSSRGRLTGLAFVFFAWFVCYSANAQKKSCCAPRPDSTMRLAELEKLYHQLKEPKMKLCCQSWGSALQEVMEQLRDSVALQSTQKEIEKIMGPPDEVVTKSRPELQISPGDVVLIYDWRGGHDYLFFVLRKKRLVSSEWYYAWD